MYQSRIIINEDPKSPISEAFRTLRTNLQFSIAATELKTLMVTSSEPSEGKSTVITNLATSMAESGKRVLLIDCDLRKPNIHRILGMPNDVGMTNLLIRQRKIDEVIAEIRGLGFDVISSGPIPPNPSELLSTKHFGDLLKILCQQYDIVLIDTPPVLAVTDAQIISNFVDGALLVVSYGKVQRDHVKQAKQLLDTVKANIIGVVFNGKPIKDHTYYYEYK